MNKIIKALNMFSAIIVLITGVYTQIVFRQILSPVLTYFLWIVVILYVVIQLELTNDLFENKLKVKDFR